MATLEDLLNKPNEDLTTEELEQKINMLSRMKVTARPVKSNAEKRDASFKKDIKGKSLDELSDEELLKLMQERKLNGNS